MKEDHISSFYLRNWWKWSHLLAVFNTVLEPSLYQLHTWIRLTLPLRIRSIFLLKFVAIVRIFKNVAYIFNVMYCVIPKGHISFYILTLMKSKYVIYLLSFRQQIWCSCYCPYMGIKFYINIYKEIYRYWCLYNLQLAREFWR